MARDIYKDKLPHNILNYVKDNPYTQRKKLYLVFNYMNYQYFARVVKQLIDKGLIQVVRKYQTNCLLITEEGMRTVCELNEVKYREIKEKKFTPTNRNTKQLKRKMLTDDMRRLCISVGMCTEPENKPDLSLLLTASTTDFNALYNIDTLKQNLKDGIFYSSAEIRETYDQIIGGQEIANWSRIVGIVISTTNAYYLYSIDSKLILWRVISESRTTDAIKDLLSDSKVLREYTDINFEEKKSIICGRSNYLLARLILARKSGKIKKDNKEISRRYYSKDFINLRNLNRVFSESYLISANRQGSGPLKLLLHLSEDKIRRISEKAIEKIFNDDPFLSKNNQHPIYVLDIDKEAIVVPVLNLNAINSYRNYGKKLCIITESQYRDPLAKILGPGVDKIYNLDGDELITRRYDYMGNPL